MKWLYQPLLMLIARSTESDMARQVEFLKAENAILRRKLPKRLRFTVDEKSLLVRLGKSFGGAITAVLTVVSYQTFRRWVNQIDPPAPGTHPNKPRSKPGRPKTAEYIRELVLRLARENDWGYTRILGELRKLGIKISRTNVVNILREHRLDPKIDPSKGTWAKFFKAHNDSLWQCDFFSKHIITPEGVRQCFILAFLHVHTRRVYLSPCTFKPDAPWMAEQANAFVAHARANHLRAEVVIRDRDGKYTSASFDSVLSGRNVKVRMIGFRAPNMNAYIERFVQSIQQECLDQFIAFGKEHLDLLAREYVEHYHQERPHQSNNNDPIVPSQAALVGDGRVICRERLGGVLRHYFRAAA